MLSQIPLSKLLRKGARGLTAKTVETEKGVKELVAVEDGYRESEASWHEVLAGLLTRGLKKGPKLAVGDWSLGFWNALRKEYPECVHQRRWVHKTANVLNKVPKSL